MIRKRSNSRLFFVLLVTLMSFYGYGQQVVSGTVTDAKTSEPLIGANVFVPGTATGTITDFDGNFSFTIPSETPALEFSYTGYNNLTVEVSNDMQVQLSEGELLDEVVVIGYGTVKREDATGSVQTVSAESFNQGAITSPQDLVAGKVAGVQISSGGDPGGGASIRIRGGSSLSASNDPLIVVDGFPLESDGLSGSRNPLNFINPNDIETFTVLKDASATAIYGSRASNGVIIITTKKGSLGTGIRLEYSGNMNVSTPTKMTDVLTGDEFGSLIRSQYGDGHPAIGLLGSANTDWQSEIYRTALGQDHNVSLSGAVKNVPIRVSFGHTNKQGVLKNDRFKRTTLSMNLNPKYYDNRLQFNLGVKTMFDANNFGNRGAIGSAIGYDPTQAIEGNFGGYSAWLQPDGRPNPIGPANPVALLNLRQDLSLTQRYVFTGAVDYRLKALPDLRAHVNVAYDHGDGGGSIFQPENAAFDFTNGGTVNIYGQRKQNTLLESYVDYGKSIGNNNFQIMGGYSWQHLFRRSSSESSNVAGDIINTPFDIDKREYYLVSLFSRLNVDLGERINLTASVRRDGSSRFAKENRWGLFPSAAVGFKLYDGDGQGILSHLKLRLGYGVTGQQDITSDFYPHLARYQSSFDNAQYQFGDDFYYTLRPGGYDANIKWEETSTYNFAIDYGLIDDRLTGSIEYYIRNTTDLINFVPVPAGTNLTNFINTNVGDLQNKGLEFAINATPVQNSNFKWDLSFNVTFNRNEITKLTAADDPDYPGVLTGNIAGGVGNTIQIHQVGSPANSFYVYEQVYDNAGIPIEGLYVDQNGDNQITPDDRYIYKNPAPKSFYGLTSRMEYKNLDFSFAGRANLGSYAYNNVHSGNQQYNNLYVSSGFLGNLVDGYADTDFAVPQYFSDHYIQDASFLRLDYLTLGYSIPNALGKSKNARVYATVQNPFVITNYKGIDPEVYNPGNPGIDNNLYPRSRTVLFGLSFNL